MCRPRRFVVWVVALLSLLISSSKTCTSSLAGSRPRALRWTQSGRFPEPEPEPEPEPDPDR